MSQVISFREVRYSHAAPGLLSPNEIDFKAYRRADERASSDARSPTICMEDVRRAILLLDIAAQHARLLVKQISDPLRREKFEAQIASIEQLLQLARQMASNL